MRDSLTGNGTSGQKKCSTAFGNSSISLFSFPENYRSRVKIAALVGFRARGLGAWDSVLRRRGLGLHTLQT